MLRLGLFWKVLGLVIVIGMLALLVPLGSVSAAEPAVKAHLVADIIEPTDFANFNVCQDIPVTARVTNTGDGAATNVRATLEWVGPASLTAGANPQSLKDLGEEQFDHAMWTLHCDGPGDVTITVKADGTDATTGNDLRTGFATPNVEDDSVTIHQLKAHLVAQITEPQDSASFGVCQDIPVNATVTNTGTGAAIDVKATLEWIGLASLTAGANPQSLQNLEPSAIDTATWTLHCDGPGNVTITVLADGTDVATGNDLRTGFATPNVEDDEVTIHQVSPVKAHLVAQITEPQDSASFGVCQDITVTATVTNTGTGTATNVRATLEWVGPASWVAGDNPQSLKDLGEEQFDHAMWTLHCDGPGDVTITVLADGTDAATGNDLRTGFATPNVEDDSVTIFQVVQPGTGTPGYWKNHPDAWPVDEITIGGVTYTKTEAINIIMTPEKGDKTYTLFRALVAAKLNVAIGNDSSCVEQVITAADDWMSTYGPPGSGVKAGGKDSPWRDGEPLCMILDAYNNGELCAPPRV